jgi:Nif-specific regulatory protein
LLNFFLAKYNRENQTRYRLHPGTMEVLVNHSWPGNVRELENTIERLAVMAKGNELTLEGIPLSLGQLHRDSAGDFISESTALFPPAGENLTLSDLEKRKVMEAMEKSGGVQSRACKLLGITPRQLGYKLKKYKIGYKPTFLS